MRSYLLFVALALVLVSVWCPSKGAAMPAPLDRPASVSLLDPVEPTSLEVKDVHTTLRCVSEPTRQCSFQTEYQIHNPTDADIDEEVVVDGFRIAGMELWVDEARRPGRPVDRPEGRGREFPAVTRTTRAYSIEVAADATVTVVVTGSMNARPPEDTAVRTPLPARHPVLGQDTAPVFLRFSFDLQPLRGFARRPSTASFDLQAPPHWQLKSPTVGDEVELVSTPVYVARAQIETIGFKHGGPYAAFGAAVEEPHGVRGRLGYEMGSGLWTVYGLAVDTDFSTHAIVAPSIHAASAAWSCIFPSFGLGLGPALRVGDRNAFGGRVQLEMQLPFVGVVGNLDWFPGLDSPDRVNVAVMGRISL